MITILTNRSTLKFKYKGKIEIRITDVFLFITAKWVDNNPRVHLPTIEGITHDAFYLNDVISVTGNSDLA